MKLKTQPFSMCIAFIHDGGRRGIKHQKACIRHTHTLNEHPIWQAQLANLARPVILRYFTEFGSSESQSR